MTSSFLLKFKMADGEYCGVLSSSSCSLGLLCNEFDEKEKMLLAQRVYLFIFLLSKTRPSISPFENIIRARAAGKRFSQCHSTSTRIACFRRHVWSPSRQVQQRR